ncbi:hypothetical protein FANTH_4942 [Fusarium anthophilum]|uniref:Uncharacterized protein n=1 Tax=Fusarium anthophilum TaxID=48485 RepID=A0A8H5E757_9HYPO|nr:hypothetical protein FANTH_4942 [Fusarium anthophilum]
MLYLWIREVDDKSFVMDASLVRNTLFLTLFKDEKPHSNDTPFAPSPTTVGQHHILEYSFGGLNLVVTSPGHLIRNGGEERFARIITSDPELEKGSCPRLLSLLWFSGTHTWVTGSVSDGVFKLREDGLKCAKKNIREWESLGGTKKAMRTVFRLLQYVRLVTMDQVPSRSCSIRFEASGGLKWLEVYAASRVQQLPTLFGEIWGEK